jgi:hypothetical protein
MKPAVVASGNTVMLTQPKVIGILEASYRNKTGGDGHRKHSVVKATVNTLNQTQPALIGLLHVSYRNKPYI